MDQLTETRIALDFPREKPSAVNKKLHDICSRSALIGFYTERYFFRSEADRDLIENYCLQFSGLICKRVEKW